MACLIACGCQKSLPISSPAPAPVRWTKEFPLEELEPQTAQTGECGLALWARAQPAPRIFFASNKRRFALINFEGQNISLDAQHDRADVVRGFSPVQHYAGPDLSLTLDLDIETRQDVVASAVIRGGVLTLTQGSTGKSLILPVVGVIGCS